MAPRLWIAANRPISRRNMRHGEKGSAPRTPNNHHPACRSSQRRQPGQPGAGPMSMAKTTRATVRTNPCSKRAPRERGDSGRQATTIWARSILAPRPRAKSARLHGAPAGTTRTVGVSACSKAADSSTPSPGESCRFKPAAIRRDPSGRLSTKWPQKTRSASVTSPPADVGSRITDIGQALTGSRGVIRGMKPAPRATPDSFAPTSPKPGRRDPARTMYAPDPVPRASSRQSPAR